VVAVVGLTVADLYWVSRRVTYAVMVSDPPVNRREESEVGRLLRTYEQERSRPVRMWAPGANIATLTGFAATPVYLGLGPAVYFEPAWTMPKVAADASPAEQQRALASQKEWLAWAVVTHILRMEPLDRSQWPEATLVWQGFDRLLNPAWGRFQQPIFLYEMSSPGPFAWLEPGGAEDSVTVSTVHAGSIVLETSTAAEGRVLTITELNYPGWTVTVDGAGQERRATGEFLAVTLPAGEHVVAFRYSPSVFWWGATISAIGWCGLMTWCVRLKRRRAGHDVGERGNNVGERRNNVGERGNNVGERGNNVGERGNNVGERGT
jgi:hypothetical protein